MPRYNEPPTASEQAAMTDERHYEPREGPIWPVPPQMVRGELLTDSAGVGFTEVQLVAHNLACIADELGKIAMSLAYRDAVRGR